METCPQNTLAAFREAIRLGAQMIEFDVRQSRDGRLFISHDYTLERLTGRKERLEELTLAELKQIDAGSATGPQFAGERIPTLEETLAIMSVNVWLLVHLHWGETELAREVARTISQHDRQHQAILATLPDRIQVAREACPEIFTANMQEHPNTPEYMNESMALGVEFVRFWSAHWTDQPLTAELVGRAKDAGIGVIYFEPREPEELARLYEIGVDFPVAESVAEMIDAASKLGIAPAEPIPREPSEAREPLSER